MPTTTRCCRFFRCLALCMALFFTGCGAPLSLSGIDPDLAGEWTGLVITDDLTHRLFARFDTDGTFYFQERVGDYKWHTAGIYRTDAAAIPRKIDIRLEWSLDNFFQNDLAYGIYTLDNGVLEMSFLRNPRRPVAMDLGILRFMLNRPQTER